MTRTTLLTLLVAAGVVAGGASDAAARKHVLRKKDRPAKVVVAAKTAPWTGGERCTEKERQAHRRSTLAAAIETSPPALPPPAAGGSGWGTAFRVALSAGAGASVVGMRVARTEGGGGLGRSLSPAYGIAGAASVRLSRALRAGIGVDALLSGPGGQGMQYQTTEDTSGAIPFQHHQVDARGELTYDAAVILSARAGYHYAHLTIDTDPTQIPIVGEAIGGYLVGLSATLPRGRVALSVVVDAMPSGAQAPTQLTDGMLYGTAASAAWAGAGLTYHLRGRWLATAAYRYGRTTIAMTDGATDPHTATRIDQSHTLLAGLGLAL
ncbi:MAG TPA: hypothetical protein VL172_09700 [Kofleriaceae bacterium]|nr:hypothetical protein [Kofleriaceae bacterium]